MRDVIVRDAVVSDVTVRNGVVRDVIVKDVFFFLMMRPWVPTSLMCLFPGSPCLY